MSLFDDGVLKYFESSEGAVLREDVKHWWTWRHRSIPSAEALLPAYEHLFINHTEFRSLVDYRVRSSESYAHLKVLPSFRRANDLYIYCDYIGPGFRIQHGHSTWLMANRVGRNFLINQNVTVGVDKGGRPTIGDDVQIRTGAVVAGPVHIGDNVTIGPNAFVNFDVPPNMVVFAARSVLVEKSRIANTGLRSNQG